jgi:arylsulfatase A-like enzyme
MRVFATLAAISFPLAGVGVSAADPAAPPPNIVLINADDLGYGDLGCYGATKLKTPNIDRLAREGRRFTDAHAAAAVCSPYGLLTGQYPLRKNFWGPIGLYQPLTIDVEQPTLASVLKSAGYATAIIGKWHLGFGRGRTDWNKPLAPGPLEVGFDSCFGMPTVNSGPPGVYVENHGVVGFDPADPFVPGQKSVTQRWPEKGGYASIGGARAAFERYRDEEVGTTFAEKAVEWIATRQQQAWKLGHRLNGDLLGFKFGAWEGGHRVPFIVRWPGKVPAGTTSDALLSQIDLITTFAAAAGAAIPQAVVDGVNQLAEFTGTATGPAREHLVISPNSPRHLTLRQGRWLLVPAQDEGGFQGKKPGDHTLGGAAAQPLTGLVNSDVVDGQIRPDAPPVQLYDLAADPRQTTNLAARQPEVVKRMLAELALWREHIPASPPLGWINLQAKGPKQR